MARSRLHSRIAIRAAVALAAGVVTGVLVTPLLGIAAGLLAGWATLALIEVVWVLARVWPMDGAQTRDHARTEDPGRPVARIVALVGGIASLGAVAVVLLQTRGAAEGTAFVLAGIAVIAVASSWALVQVDAMLRIAAVHYADPVGGIDFASDAAPTYTDFAYVAFGVGMTYQVADTTVRTQEMRRIILGQMLVSYLLGAVVLATIINLVTGLG